MSDRLEAIRERLEALDYPAWAWEPFGEKSNNFIVGVAYDGDDQIIAGRMPEDDEDAIRIENVCEKHDAVGYADATFIAHAPTDIAHLLEIADAAWDVLASEAGKPDPECACDYCESRRRLREALEALDAD